MILGIAFWLGLVVLAAWLLKRYVRGRRVGEEPRCQGCEYNLTGLESNRCPECGATLRDEFDGPLGVVYGRYQRSPVHITFAVVVLLAAGTMLVGNLAQVKVNWLRFAPTGWVTTSASTGQRSAMDELVRRYNAQTLSAEQVSVAVDAGLKIQATANAHPLLAQWMDFLGDALSAGDMTVAQETSYARNSATFTFTPRPKIRSGEALPLALGFKGRTANDQKLSMQLFEEEVRIGDVVVSSGRGEFAGFGCSGTGGGGSSSWKMREPVKLPPGDYEVVLTFHRKVFLGSTQRPANTPPDFEFDEVIRAPVTILPADADDPIQTTSDPSLEPEIRNSLSIDELKVDLSQDMYRSIHCTVDFGGPAIRMPIDLAFRIIVKTGRFELEIGSVDCAKGGETNFGTGSHLDDDVEFVDDLANAETATVILRTDMEAARRTVDLMNVWDGEIQFDDVPLTVVKPTP